MSEHNYPAPHPEESPGDDEIGTVDAPTPDDQEDEQARGARYYDEAARIYLANRQDPEGGPERLEPITELWLAFETAYAGSFEGRLAFVEHVADELGWFRIIHKIANQMGIPIGTLRIDYAAAYDYLARYFHIYRTPNDVLHVFARPGIKPMAPDIAWRGGHR